MSSNRAFIASMDLAGKRLVIFGCGYLGTRVARRALEDGMHVTALTRNVAQAGELTRLGVERVVTADLDSAEWHRWIEPRQDFVVNCVGSAGGGWEGYKKSYLEGMRSLLQWASGGSVGVVIFTSSTSVYAQDHGGWVTEDDPAEGASEGGRIVRQAEKLLEEGPPAIARRMILRLGGIYGPGRHRLLDRACVSAGKEGESEGMEENAQHSTFNVQRSGGKCAGETGAGEGNNIFLNAIHVDDGVGAIRAVFRSGPDAPEGVFNIVDDTPSPKGEIVSYLRERAKSCGLIRPADSSTETVRRRSGMRPHRKISNRKAREFLDWKPVYPDYGSGYESLGIFPE